MKRWLISAAFLSSAAWSAYAQVLPFPNVSQPHGPPPACTPSAGGTVTTVGGHFRYVVTASGTLTCSGARLVRVCLIAGGGSGAAGSAGGGGGAGGLLINASILLPSGPNSIVIGAGGVPAGLTVAAGNPGQNTTAVGLTAVGGGFGATSTNGGPGGSGGGGAPSTSQVGGTPTAGQGFAGGSGNSGSGFGAGGGGGGAGAAGTGAAIGAPGNGGNGAACPIDGTIYAGGGAGMRNGAGGNPGTGGGGAGCSTVPTANSGSGSGVGDGSTCSIAGAVGKMIMEEL